MGIVRQAYLMSEAFDFATIREDDISFGYVLDLPFRVRLGDLFRHKFSFRGKNYEVVFYNQYSIPQGTPLDKISKDRKPHSALWTRALVITFQPKISPDTLDALRKWIPKEGENPPISASGSVFASMEALNNYLVAYASGARQLFGGKPLRLLTANDLVEADHWEISIFSPPDVQLSDEDCRETFNIRVDRQFISTGSIHGYLDDLPIEETRNSIDVHLRLQESFIHHELAFEAKVKMVSGDYIGALLFAVAALEGAHAAFVQHELGRRLPDAETELPEEFIRELGMSLCNRLTPYLLMREADRPNSELIGQAGHGLRMRNEIMHSLRNRKGQYRLRTRTNKEISEAYSAVLKVYDSYVSAIANIERAKDAQQ